MRCPMKSPWIRFLPSFVNGYELAESCVLEQVENVNAIQMQWRFVKFSFDLFFVFLFSRNAADNCGVSSDNGSQ